MYKEFKIKDGSHGLQPITWFFYERTNVITKDKSKNWDDFQSLKMEIFSWSKVGSTDSWNVWYQQPKVRIQSRFQYNLIS